jgi:hypothetical protein
MHTKRACLTICTAFVAVLSLSQQYVYAASKPDPVTVTNSKSEPVPVVQQGTITITGTVNANITNTPTVKLAPGTTVQVQDSSGVQPFQTQLTCTFPTSIERCVTTVAVPSGKRLVIEYISVQGSVPPGDKLHPVVVLSNLKNAEQVASFVPVTPAGPFGSNSDVFAGSQLVKQYGDEKTLVVAHCFRFPVSDLQGTCFVTVTGHLVSAP